MLNTITLNPLEQSTQKIIDLLTQLTQDYQQLLQQDTRPLLEKFPINNQEFSILEEIDLLTTTLRGYASQIQINQQVKDPDQALNNLRNLCIFSHPRLAELYFTQNQQFPLIYQYLQKLDYLKLLLIDWLMLQS
ncbi:MAG: hypothetical protein ACKN9E_11020 [Microcystaceae cyanobacterium]